MKSVDIIQMAMTEFSKGKSLFRIQDEDVNKLHQRLRQVARRRGYWGWAFAKDGDYVIIKLSRKTNV